MRNQIIKLMLNWILKVLNHDNYQFFRIDLTQDNYDRFYKNSTLGQPIVLQLNVNGEVKENVFCYKIKRLKKILDPYGKEITI